MKLFSSADEIRTVIGTELGHSEWVEIDQARIDTFAQATNDHQWIHVDPERAATGPFGGTIAHGYLTASLIPHLVGQIFKIDAKMAVNYGLNKVRFPAPVPVGSKVRATSVIQSVTEVGDAIEVVTATTISVQDAKKPSVVAEHVGRYYL